MKKIFTLALMLAVMLFILSGCSPTNAEPADQTDKQPPAQSDKPIEPSESPEPPDTIPPSGTSEDHSDDPMTYDKYFGIERKWPDDVRLTPDEWDKWPNNTVLPPDVEGIEQIEGTWFGSRFETEESIYVLDGREVFMTSEGGTKASLIYIGECISRMYCDGIALYFLEGDMLCRMFIPDGRIEDIYPVKSKRNPDGEYYVYSNYRIFWPEGMTLEEKKTAAEKQGRTLEEFLESPDMTTGAWLNYNSMTKELLYGDLFHNNVK